MNLLMVNDAVLELHAMANEIPWKDYHIQEVFTAESADLAREILKNHTIDILLCDIEMPGEDGISLIRWIRENDFDIDCILLTCHADFAYAREAISLNCKEYIVLPTEYTHIGETVLEVVNNRKKRLDDKHLQEYGKNWIQQQHAKIEDSDQNKTTSGKETIEKCIAYIQEHLGDENLNVTDIGTLFYLNPIYLSRLFKQHKGVAINQWITTQRMELARELLADSSHTAISVANVCGYSNYPYFSTVFKKKYGCTPSQYIEQHRAQEKELKNIQE